MCSVTIAFLSGLHMCSWDVEERGESQGVERGNVLLQEYL